MISSRAKKPQPPVPEHKNTSKLPKMLDFLKVPRKHNIMNPLLVRPNINKSFKNATVVPQTSTNQRRQKDTCKIQTPKPKNYRRTKKTYQNIFLKTPPVASSPPSQPPKPSSFRVFPACWSASLEAERQLHSGM